MSRSELRGQISKFQFVNGLIIEEKQRGSINSDHKFCLPNFFRSKQNLLIQLTYLVRIYGVPMEILMVRTVKQNLLTI